MQDTNRMIEEERSRNRRIHEEEMNRAQEMFDWEKKRLEETYKTEIENLQRSLEQVNKNQNFSQKYPAQSRDNVDYLEMQLRNQKKILEDR